jgi:hypothetical protein
MKHDERAEERALGAHLVADPQQAVENSQCFEHHNPVANLQALHEPVDHF